MGIASFGAFSDRHQYRTVALCLRNSQDVISLPARIGHTGKRSKTCKSSTTVTQTVQDSVQRGREAYSL